MENRKPINPPIVATTPMMRSSMIYASSSGFGIATFKASRIITPMSAGSIATNNPAMKVSIEPTVSASFPIIAATSAIDAASLNQEIDKPLAMKKMPSAIKMKLSLPTNFQP